MVVRVTAEVVSDSKDVWDPVLMGLFAVVWDDDVERPVVVVWLYV